MAVRIWTEAEDKRLRQHSKSGPAASTAELFWSQLAKELDRSPKAIVERANELALYANSLYGAVERTCPRCGEKHVKRVGVRNPETADYCIPCVGSLAYKRHKNNHKRTCVRCAKTFLAGRRRRVCDACKAIWGDARLVKPREKAEPKPPREKKVEAPKPVQPPEEVVQIGRGRPKGKQETEAVRLALVKVLGWKRETSTGWVNQTDIARREGMTKARVSQLMELLRLPEDTQRRILDGERLFRSVRAALLSLETTSWRGV